MATSADQDDRDDEKDAPGEGEKKAAVHEDEEPAAAAKKADDEEDAKPAAGDAKKAAEAKKPAAGDAKKAAEAKPAAKKADDEEDEDEEDEEEAVKPASKPAAKPSVAANASAEPKRGGAPAVRGRRGPGAGRAAASPSGSLGKSMILFVIIVGGLAAGFAILGREEQMAPSRPKWTAGQTVDVELTVVRNDAKDLACASGEELGGKHCAFDGQDKPWSKGDPNDEKKTFKPYTTTDRIQLAGAGLWSDPGMAPDKLPPTRFSVKCKYKVDGTLKKLNVRWEQTGQWFPNAEWYAGSFSDCKIAAP